MTEISDATIQHMLEANKAQAAKIAELAQQVSDLSARVPAPEPAPLAPGQYLKFPTTVYRYHGGKPGQIDHPEHEAKIAHSHAELEAALADGWTERPEAQSKKGAKK